MPGIDVKVESLLVITYPDLSNSILSTNIDEFGLCPIDGMLDPD